MKQLVSILIPAFNAEHWIGECIQSALSQTWNRKEIILVDDGSTDATLEIAKSYASSTVEVKSQENLGASAARNYALSVAQGDYIQYLDADDLLAHDKIEKQLEEADDGNRSKRLLSGSWGRFYRDPRKARFQADSLWGDLTPVEWMYRKVEFGTWMAIESWLVSRCLSEEAGPWNERLRRANDGEYFNRVLRSCDYVEFVGGSRCMCRRLNLGISSNLKLNDKKLDGLAFATLSSVETLLFLENSERTRKACLKHLNRWSIYFYPERPDLIGQMQAVAEKCGEKLRTPRLKAKYHILERFVGFRLAKKAQLTLPTLWSVSRNLIKQSFGREC